SMTRAIVSRCKVYEFKSLTIKDIALYLKRATQDEERGLGFLNIEVDNETLEYLANQSGGDLRTALNNLELIAQNTPSKEGIVKITKTEVDETKQHASYSINTDSYYDILSAFCKSIRGSDAEAALYYSNLLLESGISPEIIARRMIAHASEDIGMADSNALLMANNALFAVKNIGLPECKLSLSHAIIYLCEAPKSNSVYLAMNKAIEDARNFPNPEIPDYLKNHPTTNSNTNLKYKYPHEFGGYTKQQYMPTILKDRVYYVPSENGREKGLVRKKVKY
ncbi:MAG: replication-associated recombination protein A, partial [Clostridia bacterium]|nr:replication-associated recombination protein A [Clostridia bacterium]